MRKLVLIMLAALAAQAAEKNRTIVKFGAETLPDCVVLNHTAMERIAHDGGYARRVRFEKADWPNVFFKAPEAGWDWRAWAGVAVSLYNPGDEAVKVAMRVDNAGADGMNNCNNAGGSVPAGKRYVLRCYFRTGDADYLWGMRGVPVRGPLGSGPELDLTAITAFQVFLPRPQMEQTLIFEKAWLFGEGGRLRDLVPMPFIDRFGQYRHEDWPGKLKDENELKARAGKEAADLAAAPRLPERDEYGGWAAGPKRAATGWFRTEKIDGKWWLITPAGSLFFSAGMDCVGTWQRTFVTGRDDWFAWLPDREDPVFGGLFAYHKDAHSGAEPIDGEGWTFGFYAANLIRKYGEDWEKTWRETTYKRLRAWGFNTIANWSQRDVLENSPMPFVVSTHVPGVRLIEGGSGYWSKMKDVFAPEFPEQADKAFRWAGDRHADNPRCIGYFCDNELAWEGIRRGTLESPADQPCRIELIRRLKKQYGAVEHLNAAWKTEAADWDALRTPAQLNGAAEKDLDAWLHHFASRYFSVIRDACRKHAPNQLYLGCRFAGPPPEEVENACAETADVISYNLYYSSIDPEQWTGKNDRNRPSIIGEFHFGALDRGMFHTGLAAAADQHERARNYIRYVRSVADHPAFVGCHWFQYVDEPNTGRWFDGENYNIGFVDVTDTPYPEMREAAQTVHVEIYPRRYHGKP
jgi:hypothetical protein